MKKILAILFAFVLAFTSIAANTEAMGIAYMDVYLNGHYVDEDTIFSVERGTTLSIRVLFQTTAWLEPPQEVKIKAWIDGYRKSIEAETERFDIIGGRTYAKSLFLYLPNDMDEGIYTLHVMITGNVQPGGESYKKFTIQVQRSNYRLQILSVDLALPASIKAGENLVGTAVVKNRGSHKLEDVYVIAEIPELKMTKRIYVGDLYPKDYNDNTERDTKSVAIVFSIPTETTSGIYTLKVKAYNEDAQAEASENFEVIGKKTEKETPQISLVVSETSKKVKAGDTIDYELTIVNTNEPLTLQLKAIGTEGWAKARFDKPIITLQKNGVERVKLTLEVEKDALEGSHIFSVQLLKDNEVVLAKNLIAEVERKEEISNVWVWVVIGILALIALALLITLIVILVKKREEVEEKPEEIYY
jgi:hypothetical protein